MSRIKATTTLFVKAALWLPALFLGIILHTRCSRELSESTEPGSPQHALRTFQIEEGFSIQLLAAEPLLGDPVDMEIDENGRLFVAEMPGYPLDKSGSGKIKLLHDTDSDGMMDSATVFAEGLVLPNSVMRWRNGLLVTDAPHVFYLEDKDGDGKAEIRDTLLTGFALSNPQHNLNSPVLGLDNWIYLAHEGAVSTETFQAEFGDRGKEIYFPHLPGSDRLAVNAAGRSVRFRPEGRLEIMSSHTQFGHAFDKWGRYLLVGNSNHIFQEVVAERYLRRNNRLLISDVSQSLSDHGDAAEVFPITRNPEHQLLTDVGVITSACGLTVYSGGIFPAPYDGAVTFVAEPVSNLVHVDVLSDRGSNFAARRVHPNKEFLASEDPKFRPVNMYVGPDGALYVVDYYRQIIEHPEWMGEEVIKSGQLYNGSEKGRIYRIGPTSAKKADWTNGLPSLGGATAVELVGHLAHQNGWWRQQAQRLLVDRRDMASLPALHAMAENQASELGRLHALWTLEGIGSLTPGQIETALSDPAAGLRENAIRLAELHLDDAPRLITALLKMGDDPDAKVRYQLLCTLGSIGSDESARVRHGILFADLDDEWVQVAALSADAGQLPSLLEAVLANYNPGAIAYGSLVERISSMLAGKDHEATHRLIRRALPSAPEQEWQGAILEGLAQGLAAQKPRPSLRRDDHQLLLDIFFGGSSPKLRRGAMHVLKAVEWEGQATASAIEKALAISADKEMDGDRRADAIDIASIQLPARSIPFVEGLLSPSEELAVQLAALRALNTVADTSVSRRILDRWKSLTPEVQEAAIGSMISKPDRLALLLTALETGRISISSVSWPRKVRMMTQRNEALRSRARSLFTSSKDAEVVKSYREALSLKGSEASGEQVYQKNCAICHQVRGQMGVSIGPDLGTIHNWSPEAILANTLDPSLSISSGYDLWSVVVNGGEAFQGIIASESPSAITFRNSGSPDKTIKRSEIRSLEAQNTSVMPADLAKQISVEEMADLLAFLKKNK